MEQIGHELQLYAGRRICDGHEVQICLISARSQPEAFDRLARRMFATRFVDKPKASASPLRLSPEQVEPVLWEGERFDVFSVVFDPTGIAPIVDVRWG